MPVILRILAAKGKDLPLFSFVGDGSGSIIARRTGEVCGTSFEAVICDRGTAMARMPGGGTGYFFLLFLRSVLVRLVSSKIDRCDS